MRLVEQTDYRAVLRAELLRRASRNPRYSLRAFARDLGLRHNRLSEILGGKQGLSPAAALAVAERLGYTAEGTAYFQDLVRSLHARSRAEREAAEQRLSEYQKGYAIITVTVAKADLPRVREILQSFGEVLD